MVDFPQTLSPTIESFAGVDGERKTIDRMHHSRPTTEQTACDWIMLLQHIDFEHGDQIALA